MASPNPTPDGESKCSSCGVLSTGKFCSNCGASLAGATCGSCDALLSPGAKFCHRCGTPAGADGPAAQRGFGAALPWAVAGIALLSVIALVAGQRFSRGPNDTPAADAAAEAPAGAAPFAGATGNGAAPDISKLTPAEAAVRLYNRVMGAHERGQADTVQLFAPMAITAYQMLGTLDLDQRYDLGRIAAISGDESVARAQADTILKQHPNHLLGLILAANAAHVRKDDAAEKAYHDKIVAAAPAERAKQLPEYITHENDITIALDAKRP
ncbi:MAG: zinc ribbon domain-containing protein [bacterium]